MAESQRPSRAGRLKLLLPREESGTVDTGHDDYDGSFAVRWALSPALWLAFVGACLLLALGAVGYLSVDRELAPPRVGPPAASAFERIRDAINVAEPNFAKRRGAQAFSGVTLAITMALVLASAVWAASAIRGKANAYRVPVLFWVAVLFGASLAILATMAGSGSQPFASVIGGELLKLSSPSTFKLAGYELPLVPACMFALACLTPAILTAGACCLLQPVAKTATPASARVRVRLLRHRLGELDQLLYVGALALVFGTLQLSAGLSLALTGMPQADDLKVQADLCKSLPPASPASSPFFSPDAPVAAAGPSFYAGFGIKACRALPAEFAKVLVANDLRQLIRGITLSFGLAYSALLAAIYVPALIAIGQQAKPLEATIRASKETPQAGLGPVAPAAPGEAAKPEEDVSLGDVDPLRRVAATVATLSPLIAGLLANAFAAG